MEIKTIPNEITTESAQAMRAVAESGCDPDLYLMAARAFETLDIPTAADRLRKKAEHYRSLSHGTQTPAPR